MDATGGHEVIEVSGDDATPQLSAADASPRPIVVDDADTASASSSRPQPVEPLVPGYMVGGVLRFLRPCRSLGSFETLNRIDEGTYGEVFRARDRDSGEVVALKRVKMDKENQGFPTTAMREIQVLLRMKHPNIVNLQEVIVGKTMDCIYLVMEFLEHEVKDLMEAMRAPFSPSEVKCLMVQLLSGVRHLHDNWILHRDLKTSNLLLNNKGILKICDFGLAREYGDPLKPYTQPVVTLWYRAPELLLGVQEYSTAIDMWAVGCIFGEFLDGKPLLSGKTEMAQIDQMFQLLGTVTEKLWPGMSQVPGLQGVKFRHQPYNRLAQRFPTLTPNGLDLLNKLLCYDPDRRISANDALKHPYFSESPPPQDPAMMPTFPSRGAGAKRKHPGEDGGGDAEPDSKRPAYGGGGLFSSDTTAHSTFTLRL